PRTKKIWPSRATAGSPSGNADVVNCCGSPVAPLDPTPTRQRSKLPARSDENTSADPSGVHAGSRSHAAPDVTRVHSPLVDTTHRSPRTLTASRPSRAYAGFRAPRPGDDEG